AALHHQPARLLSRKRLREMGWRQRPGVVSASRIGLISRGRGGIRAMTDKQFDRSTQDLGNIVNLGHVNVCISDQHLATNYYITGLGLTRDPFLNTGAGNRW